MYKIWNQIKPFIYRIRNKCFEAGFPQRRWEKNMIISIREGCISIGADCNFRQGLQLRVLNGGNIKIGRHCFINSNVCITSQKSIVIGDNVKIANNVVIVDHDHDYKNNLSTYIVDDVYIGNNTWIGANAVILKGTYIGDNCVVAAGTIVKGNFTDNSLIYNNIGAVVSKSIKREDK